MLPLKITRHCSTALWILYASLILISNLSYAGSGAKESSYWIADVQTESPTQSNSYFPLVYSGNGVSHMNINLVNLSTTGLKIGDEIGVFDGIYCVGAKIIEEKHMLENGISIPSSANDTIDNQPNGYIDGHKITLKIHRDGKVFQLYFQTVNNSEDIFSKGGSMFALVDLSVSTGGNLADAEESVKLYPMPFSDTLRIEVELPTADQLVVEIVNGNGQIIKTIHNGLADQYSIFYWNGQDNNNNMVNEGIYFCRVNKTVSKIIYKL
jgi:hypothetical protein